MGDIIIDGRVKVWEVQTIADISAPTVAELDAGTQLEHEMTPDGLIGFEPETADVDNSALDSVRDTNLPGRVSFSGTQLRFKKQSQTGGEIFELLVLDYESNLVIRTGTDSSGEWTDGERVRVLPFKCGEVVDSLPEDNTLDRFTVPVKLHKSWDLRAVVTEESS